MDAAQTLKIQHVRTSAGAARDYGLSLADVLAAAEAGWREAGGLADAVAEADALLAELDGRRHQSAA